MNINVALKALAVCRNKKWFKCKCFHKLRFQAVSVYGGKDREVKNLASKKSRKGTRTTLVLLNELFQHYWHFLFVVEAVLGNVRCYHALEVHVL